MLSIDLSHTVALVTGATGDLGSVIVRTLSSCGAKVVINYRDKAKVAERLCEEINGTGRSAMTWKADICVGEDVERMRAGVKERFGSADIIVTAAVIQYTPWQGVLHEPVENYHSQFASSVLQNVLMAKAFLPDMILKGWGRVIGINTECSMQCWEKQSAYISGKRGMDGLLRVLAKEVGPHNITVNQVAPGWIASANRPEEDTPYQQAYKKAIPLRRRGSPQEVANSVAFLASDLANFITGLYLPVSGGNVMPTI